MPPRPVRVRGPLAGMSATLVVAVAAAAAPTVQASAAPVAPTCVPGVSFTPEPAGEAIETRYDRSAVSEVNDLTTAQVRSIEADPTAWVDGCGAVFYVDPTTPTAEPASGRKQAAAAATPIPPDVLNLSSRPGANRTIYLDFTGAVTTGTAWNTTAYGDPIISPPYSLNAPADTNFDTEERAEIYAAWRSVAEDFAPFDVNVTTAEPHPDALTRTSSADPTYGTRAVITPTNVIGDGCGCGGVAYLDTFDLTGAERYQPAWVFSDAAGRTGVYIAQAISHEVGHNFGLSHDGNATQSYDSGYDGWAPIMGASYGERVSQWSAGEYPGANNPQDDLAIIAAAAPVVSDDHADGPDGATVLTDGHPLAGVLAARADADAFTFTAAGKAFVSVSGPDGVSNADLALRILNAAGQQIAASNPTRPDANPEAAMHAAWSATLPPTPGTYTAIVDGVGWGNPTSLGRYSDYGSLGAYTISLSANDPTPALALNPTTTTIKAQVGQTLAPTRFADPSGGHPPYAFTAAIIPSGLSFDDNGYLFGTPDYPGSRWLSITVTDSHDATATASVALVIDPATPVDPTDPTITDPTDDAADDGDDVIERVKVRTRHLPSARTGKSYRAVIKVSVPADAKMRVRGLPRGLKAVSRGQRIVVRGTPRQPGTHRIKVTLSAANDTARRTFTLRIR